MNDSDSTVREQENDTIEVRPVFGEPLSMDHDDWPDVFVLMPLKEPFYEIYEDFIKPAVHQFSATCKVADDFKNARDILADIWTSIYRSKVCIADCTERNPNVFYEIGIAHTIGKPVVLITQSWDDLPFDVSRRRAIQYGTRPRELQKLADALKQTLQTELSPLLTSYQHLEVFLVAEEEYLDRQVPQTRVHYANRLKLFREWLMLQSPAALHTHIEKFLHYLQYDRDCKPRTVQAYLTPIKGVIRTGTKHEPQLAQVLVALDNITFPTEIETDPRIHLTKQELDALVAAPGLSSLKGLRDTCIIELIIEAHLRAAEVATLTWGQFVLARPLGIHTREGLTKLPDGLSRRIQAWARNAALDMNNPNARVFFPITKEGKVLTYRGSLSPPAINKMISRYAQIVGLPKITAKDLSRAGK